MAFLDVAGIGGIGFVIIAVGINVVYLRAGLPLPVSGAGLERVTEEYAAVAERLKLPSIAAPATWLLLTAFAAGLTVLLWLDGAGPPNGWALLGLGGVLMQNTTFAVVEALRFGMASAATHRDSMAGLWGLGNVLFGFNQVFLATAVLGFTMAGADSGVIAGWHLWLGIASAVLLFASATISPYNVAGSNRLSIIGLVGWLGWIGWIVAYSITLLGTP